MRKRKFTFHWTRQLQRHEHNRKQKRVVKNLINFIHAIRFWSIFINEFSREFSMKTIKLWLDLIKTSRRCHIITLDVTLIYASSWFPLTFLGGQTFHLSSNKPFKCIWDVCYRQNVRKTVFIAIRIWIIMVVIFILTFFWRYKTSAIKKVFHMLFHAW